jgi:hypothetical protein
MHKCRNAFYALRVLMSTVYQHAIEQAQTLEVFLVLRVSVAVSIDGTSFVAGCHGASECHGAIFSHRSARHRGLFRFSWTARMTMLSRNWSAPLGVDKDQAAVLPVCRMC